MKASSSFRHTSTHELPSLGIGARHHIVFHEYVPAGGRPFDPNATNMGISDFKQERAYIQASLHCDELPGMLALHHFLKMLDIASNVNGILKPITIVPFANPIGLQQIVMGSHLGRFSLSTGVNFNRDWIDVTSDVAKQVESKLTSDLSNNTAVIRQALLEETNRLNFNTVEKMMKKALFQRATVSSIVLDLHCDSDAVLHTYTHDRLWPKMQDLAIHLQSKCNLLSPESGGNPFDESCSCPWATLMDRFQDRFPVEMGCQSVTVELRGESEVYDELAIQDAVALYDFFVGRGYLLPRSELNMLSGCEYPSRIPAEILAASADEFAGMPLTGVDMMDGPAAGILAWKVRSGDYVEEGQLLGEVVNMEDIDAPRIPIVARTSGIVFGMRRHKLCWPGETVIKVAGKKALQWRKGNLLTL